MRRTKERLYETPYLNDRVLFRGEHAATHSVAGTVETIRDGQPKPYGIRLENGDFVWAAADQLKITTT
jgi:hypothetical protein